MESLGIIEGGLPISSKLFDLGVADAGRGATEGLKVEALDFLTKLKPKLDEML